MVILIQRTCSLRAPQRVPVRGSDTFFAMKSARFSFFAASAICCASSLLRLCLCLVSSPLPRLGQSLVSPDLYTVRLHEVKICADRDNTFFCDKSETIINCNLLNILVIVRCNKIDHILSFIYVGVVRDEREAEVRHRRDGRRGGSEAEAEAEQKAETTQRRKSA